MFRDLMAGAGQEVVLEMIARFAACMPLPAAASLKGFSVAESRAVSGAR